MLLKIPYQKQENDYYCGPAVLSMSFAYFGKQISQKGLADRMGTTTEAPKNPNYVLARIARKFGFKAIIKRNSTFEDIEKSLKRKFAVIVNYIEPDDNVGHFAIVLGFTKKEIVLNDPWHGPKFKLSKEEFLRRWWNHRKTIPRWTLTISR